MDNAYSRKAKLIVFAARIGIALVLFIMANIVLIEQEHNRKISLQVQSIQNQINKVQDENKNMYISLETSNSYENLEKIAVDKLNMVYPDKVIFLKKE